VTAPDVILALAPFLEILRRLGVRHYLGGSIASSAHGFPRASIDADVVAALLPGHATSLSAALSGTYYVPEQTMREAIVCRRSFNIIHLETMMKVDVFVARERPFDQRALDRAQMATIEGHTIPVASPEDTLLAKLEWYRRGGEVSERQWGDVLGLIRTGKTLDARYLRDGARELDVSDLLQRAWDDATPG
jgi:hypothetical protein